jgi:hypothetical protein
MRSWLFVFAFFASYCGYGQDTSKPQFLQVHIGYVTATPGYTLAYVSSNNETGDKLTELRDSLGELILFPNLPAAVQWMDSKGWEIFATLPTPAYHTYGYRGYRQPNSFLMRRKKAAGK